MNKTPTDSELADIYRRANGEDVGKAQPITSQRIFAAMRAAIAEWGMPPAMAVEPVAWQQGSLTTVNQDPYPSLGNWFVQFWDGDEVAARVYGNDMETLQRRCAAIKAAHGIEAEVRKDDEALIRQLVEALEVHCEMTRSIMRSEWAIRAGRARLEGQGTSATEPEQPEFIVSIHPPQSSGFKIGNSTGVMVTHTPTGLQAVCDSERSQHRNKEIAMQRLRALIAEKAAEPQAKD